jgi:hypothetical protein
LILYHFNGSVNVLMVPLHFSFGSTLILDPDLQFAGPVTLDWLKIHFFFCFRFFFSQIFIDPLYYCAGVWFQRAWRGWWLARGEGRCGRRGRHRIRYQFRILRPGSGPISPRGGKIFWIHKVRQRGTSPLFIGDRYPLVGTVNW